MPHHLSVSDFKQVLVPVESHDLTGDLRFAAPQSSKASGHFMADTFGHQCIQGTDGGGFGSDPRNILAGYSATNGPATSEDCLFLNVYLPPNATLNDKLPVMFWIHGGG
jgi:carboxylesterase type B